MQIAEWYDEAVFSYEDRDRHRSSVHRFDVMDVDAACVERRSHPRPKSSDASKECIQNPLKLNVASASLKDAASTVANLDTL
jgi:hypothetical protein